MRSQEASDDSAPLASSGQHEQVKPGADAPHDAVVVQPKKKTTDFALALLKTAGGQDVAPKRKPDFGMALLKTAAASADVPVAPADVGNSMPPKVLHSLALHSDASSVLPRSLYLQGVFTCDHHTL